MIMQQAVFHKIDQSNWKRKEYFDYFFTTVKSKYSINAEIDLTQFLAYKQKQHLKFFPSFLYVILKVVNQHQEFRFSLDSEGNLGYWDYLHPSYTIFHEDDETFSDIWSHYSPDFKTFYQNVLQDMQHYKHVKKIKAKSGQPLNFCPVSSLPWLSFSGFSQDTYAESSLLFPIIRFGKYYQKESKIFLPISIFVHHAVADGFHTCRLINEIQIMVDNAECWM